MELTKTSRKTAASGYKVVLLDEDSGRMYSPATFVEYKTGKVPELSPPMAARIESLFYPECVSIFQTPTYILFATHNQQLSGCTSVFKLKRDAERLARRISAVIKQGRFKPRLARLSLRREQGILTGALDQSPVLAGNEILDIRILTDNFQ